MCLTIFYFKLNREAQAYADKLMANGNALAHDPSLGKVGENLSAGFSSQSTSKVNKKS